ncbi:MAG: hypothetical protein AAF907_08995 [Planctomycetota bacterium]
MTDYEQLLNALDDGQVEHVVIGGIAANAHGSARYTQDVDVVYGRSTANLQRLVAAISPLDPYLRGAPPGLPFTFDVPTLEAGLNFTLVTAAGDLDLLGHMSGGGTYNDLLPHVVQKETFGRIRPVLSLRALIQAKRAAGRVKDLAALAELEALLEEQESL